MSGGGRWSWRRNFSNLWPLLVRRNAVDRGGDRTKIGLTIEEAVVGARTRSREGRSRPDGLDGLEGGWEWVGGGMGMGWRRDAMR